MKKLNTIGIASCILLVSCGNDAVTAKASNPVSLPQTNSATFGGPLDFAEKFNIPYKNMSAAQLDTLCVDLSAQNVGTLQTEIDINAAASDAQSLFWYTQYKLNDQDYTMACAGSYPLTFISVRTGVSYTVNNLAECRTATSSKASAEYVAYLNGGGKPVLITAKLKATSCSGGAAPYKGRVQSVHGAMIDDYRATPASYP